MILEEAVEVKPLGTFCLSGTTMKWSTLVRLRLRCTRCGFAVLGHVQDGEFVAKASDVWAALDEEPPE